MSYFTQVSYSDSGSVDAFQRLRISTPETIFQTQSQYRTPTIEMENGVSGTGVAVAYDVNSRMNTLATTAGTGTCFMQSYQYIPYQPGKSQFIAITGVLGSAVANVTKDFGYFDLENGIIFRQKGTSGLQVIRRTKTSGSVVDNAVNSSAWNLDKMDGTGASGITFNVATSFILVIDLQFLGMGRVRVGFDIDGIIYYVHQFLNANNLSVPYMQTASLPVQALITSTSSAAPASMSFKCATVVSEGGFLKELGFNFATPESTATAGNGTRTHILSIRPKALFTSNNLANRTLLYFDGGALNMIVTGNNPVYWELVVGATLTGTAWADVNATNSATEYTTAGTFSSLTSGTVLRSGYLTSNANGVAAQSIDLNFSNPITLNRAGANITTGTLTLLVTGIGGTSATRASVSFIEVR